MSVIRSDRTRLRLLYRLLALAVCVRLVVGSGAVAEAAPGRVVILTEDNPAYAAAVEAALAPLRDEQVEQVILDRSSPQAAAEAVARYDPEVIMAVGSGATKLAQRAFPDVPIVFAMVLNPVQSGILEHMDRPNSHVTGAVMDIPFELQFAKFREVMPGLKRLGVLSNPEETGSLVEAAQVAAEKMGLTLVIEPVQESSQVASSLKRLLDKRIDGLWTVADRTVVSRSTLQVILRETARARVPTMGLSAQHCRAGFLFALDVNFAENGRQAGEMAVRVAKGDSPKRVDIGHPHEVNMAVNTRIAEFIGHEIPTGVVDSATNVYR